MASCCHVRVDLPIQHDHNSFSILMDWVPLLTCFFSPTSLVILFSDKINHSPIFTSVFSFPGRIIPSLIPKLSKWSYDNFGWKIVLVAKHSRFLKIFLDQILIESWIRTFSRPVASRNNKKIISRTKRHRSFNSTNGIPQLQLSLVQNEIISHVNS